MTKLKKIKKREWNTALKAHKNGQRVRMTFRAATRSHYRKATRIVIEMCEEYGNVFVSSYHGWSGFLVRNCEIISFEIEPEG